MSPRRNGIRTWNDVNFTTIGLIRGVRDRHATTYLTFAETAVLKDLLSYMRPDGLAWPSAKTLAWGLSCSDKTVLRAIEGLESKHYLKKKLRKGSPLYTINIAKIRSDKLSDLKGIDIKQARQFIHEARTICLSSSDVPPDKDNKEDIYEEIVASGGVETSKIHTYKDKKSCLNSKENHHKQTLSEIIFKDGSIFQYDIKELAEQIIPGDGPGILEQAIEALFLSDDSSRRCALYDKYGENEQTFMKYLKTLKQ